MVGVDMRVVVAIGMAITARLGPVIGAFVFMFGSGSHGRRKWYGVCARAGGRSLWGWSRRLDLGAVFIVKVWVGGRAGDPAGEGC